MHDLFEGIVLFEFSMCLQRLISEKYFSLDMINNIILAFPYDSSDRVNKPQQIQQHFSAKKTIGGNGHENWTLLRLLPFVVGHLVLEKEKVWETLKDIIEIVCSCKFSEETLCYLETEISNHRQLLREVFPN